MAKEVELGGRTWRVRYTYNSLADLEEKAGKGISKIFEADSIGLGLVRILIWAGLKSEEHGLTVDRVGNMIESYIEAGGDLASLTSIFAEAMQESAVMKGFTAKNG